MKDGEIKNKLSPAQVSVMRHKVTEPPYFGKYWDHFDAGIYACAACDTRLFDAADKFDSKTGWPTFKKPLSERDLQFKDETGPDDKIEIRCKKCKSHLGYVISGDNPYYRINSVCLSFTPTPPVIAPAVPEMKEKTEEKKPSALPEFPLPAPAITLIEDEPAPGWSIMSLVAGTVAGIIIGASGYGWYSNRAPADTATSTPESVATTTDESAAPEVTDDTEPERPAVIPNTTPEPEETPVLPAETGTTSQ